VVEPRLKTQWFIRTKPLAAKAMAAVREGRVHILPARFEKVFFHWLENIRDWNVSRQLWWGHRIPAWTCPDGHVTVSELADGPGACASCGRPAVELTQDPDIFDTWFSSGLWPFSTLGWPERTDDLERYYPGTVMETGYDILFFWVARMMMLGEWLTGVAPFETVYLSGLVKDPEGQKMSKTKGTGVDPLATIAEIGADALRFALVNGIAPGADVKLGRSRLDGARNFSNKLWNATRFVLSARPAEVPADAPLALPPGNDLGPAERWILGRCAGTIEAVSRAHDGYQLGEVTRLLYEAVWSEYCDWYLELAKARLADPAATPAARAATWWTLAWVLERYVRLLHPVMPFITEAIWERLPHEPGDPDLLIVADWPDGWRERDLADPVVGAAVEALIDLVRAIRNARAEAGIEAGTVLEADIVLPDTAERDAYAALAEPFGRLARLRPVRVHESLQALPPSTVGGLVVIAAAGEARLSLGSGDLGRERARLERELGDVRLRLAATDTRLADAAFTTRAPAAVVEGARRRRAELAEQEAALVGRIADLGPDAVGE
jgi:valyl-tRNA synthetase